MTTCARAALRTCRPAPSSAWSAARPAAPAARRAAPRSSPGAKFCIECGTPLRQARPRRPRASRHRRSPPGAITSVLFGDLVGLHPAVGDARPGGGPRAAVPLLRGVPRIVGALRRHGREVHRRRGDGGVGRADRPRGRRRARGAGRARAGRRAAALGEEVGVPGLAMRVGIVTGEVAVTVGARASRAWSPATRSTPPPGCSRPPRPGQVWVDETTRLLTTRRDHLRRRRQHRSRARPSRCRCGRCAPWSPRSGGAPARRRPRGAAGRPRPRAAAGQGALPRRRGDRPPGAARRRRRRRGRQVPAGLGVREVRRRAQPTRAAGTAAAASPTARASRSARWPRRSAAGCEHRLGGATSRRGRPDRLARAAAWRRTSPTPTSATGCAPRLGALLGIGGASATFPREDLFAAWTTFLERVERRRRAGRAGDRRRPARRRRAAAASSSTCWPRRVPVLRRAARPGPAARRPPGAGHQPPGDRGAPRAADRRATWPRCSTASSPAARPRCATQLVRARRGRPAVRRRDGALADRPRPRRPAGRRSTCWPTRDALDLDAIGAPASLQALVAARLDAPDARRSGGSSTGPASLGDSFDARGARRAVPRRRRPRRGAGRAGARCRSCASSEPVQQRARAVPVRAVRVRQVAYAHAVAARPQGDPPRSVLELLMARRRRRRAGAVIAQHYLDAVEAVPDDPDVDRR